MKGWMERENEMIACCSDGTRPVIFKMERIVKEEKKVREQTYLISKEK